MSSLQRPTPRGKGDILNQRKSHEEIEIYMSSVQVTFGHSAKEPDQKHHLRPTYHAGDLALAAPHFQRFQFQQ